jgi:pyridoxamine 5'-phosphate oxidase
MGTVTGGRQVSADHVSDEEDRELRARLGALRVFDGELPTFDTEHAGDDPVRLFRDWLYEAIEAGLPDPHAMTLSTVDGNGHPRSRVLLLKGLSEGRWQFATSRTSSKGLELASTPWAAANFYWRDVARQVRLTGRVSVGTPAEAARDFRELSASSRAESLTGNQSAVLTDPRELDAALIEARARVDGEPTLVPGHWTVYHLTPDEIEFWQADRARRHTRLRYQRGDRGWTRQLLWP